MNASFLPLLMLLALSQCAASTAPAADPAPPPCVACAGEVEDRCALGCFLDPDGYVAMLDCAEDPPRLMILAECGIVFGEES